MQQRGIRADALEALLDYGRITHLSDGCDIVFFDKKARRRLAEAHPAAPLDTSRISRTYAIVASDSSVITVGHRYRRIRRS